jgi:hypothetical protein
MPASTISLKYKPNDFFYNVGDPTQNADLIASFPFQKEKVVEWANRVANLEPPLISDTIIDIFDPKISLVILNADYDFKNSFLPGNMVFNDKFDTLTMNLTGISTSNISNKISPQSALITGNIVLKPISTNDKPTTLEINSGVTSNINWKRDETNAWQPDFDINAGLSQQIPFTDIDGGKSTLIMTSGNPRCKYRGVCTMKHWYYSGGCTTNIVEEGGKTRCVCNCLGTPVLGKGEAHSHCDPYTINENGSVSTPQGPVTPPTGLGLVAAIQGIKMNLKASFPPSQFFDTATDGIGGNISLPFSNTEQLLQNSQAIRELVFDYYSAVNENITLQKTILEKGSKDITSKQALKDANVHYKTEYLNVFNIITGIAGAAGYIFLLLNEKELPAVGEKEIVSDK